ncbi:hypothetical protein [Nannocystis pusilla]|uniref:hypothetical protein n=1 Tax=Nannocystis pusilla TaxID=889268 RepID=UPI003B7B90F2
MNVALVIIAAWWSAVLAPIEPTNPKGSAPILNPKVPPPQQQVDNDKFPQVSQTPKFPPPPEQIDTSKLPKVTQAPKFSFKSGSYSAESMKLPEVMPLEKFDHWQGGPNWPYLETPSSSSPTTRRTRTASWPSSSTSRTSGSRRSATATSTSTSPRSATWRRPTASTSRECRRRSWGSRAAAR